MTSASQRNVGKSARKAVLLSEWVRQNATLACMIRNQLFRFLLLCYCQLITVQYSYCALLSQSNLGLHVMPHL